MKDIPSCDLVFEIPSKNILGGQEEFWGLLEKSNRRFNEEVCSFDPISHEVTNVMGKLYRAQKVQISLTHEREKKSYPYLQSRTIDEYYCMST